jgi:hypothetical protein
MRSPILVSDSGDAVLPRAQENFRPRGPATVGAAARSGLWQRYLSRAGAGRVLLGVCGILLASCTAIPSQDERESWLCERTADGNDWICSDQRVARGVPVVMTPTGSLTAVAESRRIARDAPTENAITADGQSGTAPQPVAASSPAGPVRNDSGGTKHWRETLPALSAGVTEASLDPAPTTAGQEERRQSPEPEPAFARWEKTASAAKTEPEGQASPESLPKPHNVPAVDSKPPFAPTDSSTSVSDHPVVSGPAYTVQIGAFKTERAARAYIVQHDLGRLPAVAIQQEVRGRNEYSLITFGRFASPQAALEAWRRDAGSRDLDIWVRPVRTAPPLPGIAPEAASTAEY